MRFQYYKISVLVYSIILIIASFACIKNPSESKPITAKEQAKIPFDKLPGKIAFKRTIDDRPGEYFFMMLNGDEKRLGVIAILYTNNPTNLLLSPDASQILFSYFIFKGQIQSFLWQIYVMNLESLAINNATPSLYDDSYGARSPGGRKIAFWSNRNSQSSIWMVDLETDSSYHLADIDDLTRTRPTWFSDGEHLVFASTDSNFKPTFFQLELATQSIQQVYSDELTTNDVIFKHPILSPNNMLLAFVKSYKNKFDEIWIYNFQTKSANQLTTEESDWHPAWSPDGKTLLFSRGKHLYIINKNGSDLMQVTFSDHLDEYPSWVH